MAPVADSGAARRVPPSLLGRRRRIDQALFTVEMETHPHEVSTRKINDPVRAGRGCRHLSGPLGKVWRTLQMVRMNPSRPPVLRCVGHERVTPGRLTRPGEGVRFPLPATTTGHAVNSRPRRAAIRRMTSPTGTANRSAAARLYMRPAKTAHSKAERHHRQRLNAACSCRGFVGRFLGADGTTSVHRWTTEAALRDDASFIRGGPDENRTITEGVHVLNWSGDILSGGCTSATGSAG